MSKSISKIIGNNDLKLLLKKFGIMAGWVVLSGLIALWQDDPKWMVLVPILETMRSAIKHR